MAEEKVMSISKEYSDLKMKSQRDKDRFDDAIKREQQLEKTIKEQEETIVKRHKELDSLLASNKMYKNEIDGIRQRFGNLDDIVQKMELAELRESKVNDLLGELEHNMVSIFFHYFYLIFVLLSIEIIRKPAFMS